MTTVEPWEHLVQAEKAYLEARMRLYEAGSEHQLRLALASPRGRGTALRVLRDAPEDHLMALFPALFAAAVSGDAQVGLARDIIGRIDAGWLSVALPPLIDETLSDDDVDHGRWRRLAQALSQWGQTGLLEQLVVRAAQATDYDIREVAEDYRT